MSGSVSNWARFNSQNTLFTLAKCNMSAEAALEIKTLADKRGYQQLMFITQRDGVTVDGKLSPTVNALLFQGPEISCSRCLIGETRG